MKQVFSRIFLSVNLFLAASIHLNAQKIKAIDVLLNRVNVQQLIKQPRNNQQVITPINILLANRITNTTSTCLNITCGPLPVTLLDFTGRRINEAVVQLNWKTTNEINTKGFEVERSYPTQDNFTKIDFVPSQLTAAAQKKYQLFDDNSFDGISYYRLKMLDIDNKFTYSKIIEIRGYPNAESLQLFPNPVKDLLQVDVFSKLKGFRTLILLDATGRQVQQQNVMINEGSNLNQLNVSTLPPGFYTLKLVTTSAAILQAGFIKN